jgi:signal transduction histidine kinase
VRKLAPDLPVIMADAVQLEQAFLNLILNAVQAMPRGGRLTLTAAVTPGRGERPYIVIDFKDTGEGMSVTQQKSAFTSLLKTTKSRGTGLGLALVRRVAETHRGVIKLKSRPGHGTTFRITLPV